MKIGVINFEVSPAGLNQLLEKIMMEFEKAHTVKGIKLSELDNALQYIDFGLENAHEVMLPHKRLVPPSPLRLDTSIYTPFSQFDVVIIAGPEESFQLVEKLNKDISETRFLFVPVSIYNDITGSDLSLGYDTAVNYIVDSILKIRDTIDSLKYPHPRLFGVQLTGNASSQMLEEISLAAESQVIFSDWENFDAEKLNASLENDFAAGYTHAFIIFDSTIEPENVPDIILPSNPVNWQMVQIDEALCMGPNPTALDRVIAMQFAQQAVSWIDEKGTSGRLLVQNRKAVFEEI